MATVEVIAIPPPAVVEVMVQGPQGAPGGGGGSGTAATTSFTPFGNISANNVQGAIQELDTEKSATNHTHPAQTATNTPFTPAGTIAATDVQAAIVEVATEAVGGLTATSLSRLVQSGGSYGTRPSAGYVDFFGPNDPGVAILLGDTWTETPAWVAAAPTGLAATPGSNQMSLSWVAPTNPGSNAITDYQVQYKLASEPTTWTTFAHAASTTTAIIVTGLTGGSSYNFRVAAVTSAGVSPHSSTVTATPTAPAPTVPGAPTIGTATGGNGQATVNWSAPGSNGGSAITGYRVTPYIGSTAQTAITVGNVLTTVVTGLTNDTTYTFKVAAINAIGTGPDSAASNAVTPSSGPTQLLRQSARDQESTLEWTGLLNCTPVLTTAQFHGGAQSVEAAALAAAETAILLKTPWVAATPGIAYEARAWIRFEGTRFPAFMIRFSNGSGNDFLGDFQANPQPTAGVWMETVISGVAPAGAANIRIQLSSFGMAAGEKFWLDDVSLVAL